MRLLLIEDDPLIGSAVRDSVNAQGHAVDWAKTLGEAEALRAVVAYDLVLLDLMLPDGPGLRLLSAIRTRGEALPVIILTARDQVSDRIAGLKAGADDYLVKPFDLDELSARIGAVARRSVGAPNPSIQLGALTIHLANHRIERAGKVVSLTAREWAVLETLLQRPQAVIPKGQIEERLYALGAEVESNTIEVYVARLRKKLGAELIATERGLGYRLGLPPGAPS
ncbi:MAG: response regulator transcription factor [Proteobacteria bacterium]|nr:response regulator transcription factor [Pseudomonadota bacterium]